MGNQQNRRRQIVVDKAFQSRIIFATAWAPGLCLAATSLLLGVFCARLYNEAIQADVDLPSIIPVFVVSVSFMLIATVYMLFGALKFSHRIAGPVYNIVKTLDLFQRGDAGARIHLRKGDYLADLADRVNGFIDWLEEHPPAGYERISAERAVQPADDAGAGDDGDQGTQPPAGSSSAASGQDEDADGDGDREEDLDRVEQATGSKSAH